ncbi:MAG: NifB/NifX family molybdenum-iron cluster-binding protein [Deltaproteobacteria bacterium]|nr:MAG: NifB/NifX family molybdenum-iron cluster-binding protein [Deltaproteobacteria bacterium]
MKVAVSSMGSDLDAQVDPRFGRCAYFLIVNPDDMTFEAFGNESVALGGGAGIQSGQFIASKGANVVITGNVGPNASRTLNAAGVDVIVGVSGPIREAIERYKRGELSPTDQASVPGHFGMGMGRGTGRGMGMQGGYARNQGTSATPPDEELRALKEEEKTLLGRLNSILARIKDLEEK